MKFAYLIEPPFNYRDDNGAVNGCDVELARHVFVALGVDRFEPVETEFAELLPGVAAGRWQMTTGLFATDERRAVASFSRPIWALADGLLVEQGNPRQLTGYRSVTKDTSCGLAVVEDQVQHASAVRLGVPEDRIRVFKTYGDAAGAVGKGLVGAFASVGRAHAGFIERNPDCGFEAVMVPREEGTPAFGSFAFARSDDAFRKAVDDVLDGYLGSPSHRRMMSRYGFSGPEIDLLVA